MGLSCGMKCARLLLFAFNFVFWILGVAVLGIGIWSRIQGDEPWDSLIQGNPQVTAANMMIASGVVVTIIGFLGCCGAIKKSPCMLISYAILIFLIFALELAAGIYAYTKKDVIKAELVKGLQSAINISYAGPYEADKALTEGVDWFQQEAKCCGTQAPGNWRDTKWYKDIKRNPKPKQYYVPESCCTKKETDCNKGTVAKLKKDGKIFPTGCVPQVEVFLTDHLSRMYVVAGAAVGIAVIQLLGIVFACCLCQAIKDDDSGKYA